MRQAQKNNIVREIIDMNERLQKEIAQGATTPHMSNAKIVEQLLKMGANINQPANAAPTHSASHPVEDLISIFAKLLGTALIEQLPPAPDQPLDPFWVNDTGFRLAFVKTSEKLKEHAALPLPAIAAQSVKKHKL